MMMKWIRNGYLDLTLVPLSLLLCIVYYVWLCCRVKSQPHQTDIGINTAGRRLWLTAMLKENNKKDILVVQTIRNSVMGSTVMATSSIFLSSGLAAIITATYNRYNPTADSALMIDAVFGAHGDLVVVLKYATILLFFVSAFLFYSLSINIMNQVVFLINIPQSYMRNHSEEDGETSMLREEYMCGLLEKGFMMHIVGNRLLYAGLPLLFWVFEPVLVFLASLLMISVMYNIDIVDVVHHGGKGRPRSNGDDA